MTPLEYLVLAMGIQDMEDGALSIIRAVASFDGMMMLM